VPTAPGPAYPLSWAGTASVTTVVAIGKFAYDRVLDPNSHARNIGCNREGLAMKFMPLSGGIAMAIFAAIGVLALSGAYADQHVYEPPDAEQQYLAKGPLAGAAGHEAHVRHITFPPGWVGGKHSHLGDVYVYVLEGSMVVQLEGQDAVTVGPGELFHEGPNTVMHAANTSKIDPLKIVLFQVNPAGQPLMIKAD